MNHFLFRFLLLCLCFASVDAWAQNQSQKNGDWDDPAVWATGQVPDMNTDVLISSGDTVALAIAGAGQACANLTIEDGGGLLLKSQNFTVHGDLMLHGGLIDSDNLGNNVFAGEVSVENTGYWDTRAVTNAARVKFENGLIVNGDSILLNKATFGTNDQSISGTKAIHFPQNVSIEDNVTLTNLNPAGIVFDNGSFQTGPNSVFRNESLFQVNHNRPILQGGSADFTKPGNVVEFIRSGVQNIDSATFYHLVLTADTSVGNARRNLNGPVRVINRLEVAPNIQFAIEQYDLTVDGYTYLQGRLDDGNTNGESNFYDLELAGGVLEGNGGIWGRVIVNNEMIISDGSSRIDDADLQVLNQIVVKSGVAFSAAPGTGNIFNVHGLLIEEGGSWTDNSPDQTFTFSGPVQVFGSFSGQRAAYVFEDQILIGANGLFQSQNQFGAYSILNGINNNGTFTANQGTFLLAGPFAGSSETRFNVNADVIAGAVLHNASEGGLVFNRAINGENSNSVFENNGLVIFSPTLATLTPMSTGNVDFCSYPGNTVRYAAAANNQQLLNTCYENLELTNGSKLLTDGDLRINGNLHIEVELKENTNLFTPGPVIFMGDSAQTISGNGIIQNLEVIKSQGSLTVLDTITITKSLVMEQGILTAKPGAIGMVGNSTLSETDFSYVLGTIGAERNVVAGSNNSFGGLGIKITADPNHQLGNTLVVRVTGEAYEAGQIDRYFIIDPTNNQSLSANVEFLFRDQEINGAPKMDLELMHQVDGGSFENLEGRVKLSVNSIQKNNIDRFGILTAKSSTIGVNAWPSPFIDDVTIDYAVSKSEVVNVNIFDQGGRSVFRQEVDATAGHNRFSFSPQGLSAGIYYIRVVSSERVGYRKILKITP